MDEVEDEVVSPGHQAVLEDLFGLSGVEVVVRIRLLKSEAEPGFPGLEADAPLGAAVRAVKVREVVSEEVDLVLGEVVDELAVEGPALDLIATGELLEKGAVEDEAGFGLNGDGTSGEADLVELRGGDSRAGTFVGEGDDGEGAKVSAPDVFDKASESETLAVHSNAGMDVEGLTVQVPGEPLCLLVEEVLSVLRDGQDLLEVAHDVREESVGLLGVVVAGGDGEIVFMAARVDLRGAQVDNLVVEAEEVGLLVELVGEVGVSEEHGDLLENGFALAGIFEVEDDVIDSGELLLEFFALCLVGLEEEGRDLVMGGLEGDGESSGHGAPGEGLFLLTDPECAVEPEVGALSGGDPDEVAAFHEDEEVGLAGVCG